MLDLLKKLFAGGEREPAAKPTRLKLIHPPNSYPRRAVGEAGYQEALHDICGGYAPDGHEHGCIAHLIPEPTNEHDSNAVAVHIHGRKVAYLSRDDAIRYRDEMARAGFPGASLYCPAMIVGGWKRGRSDIGHFGVRLGVPGRGRFNVVEFR